MNINDVIAGYLFNPEMKAKILKGLNDDINIPIIGEKTEAKILDAIYSTIEAILKKVLQAK
tara:strand:+ start:174 stop:356 length:183 start_codon:yes stop_codon:yes gene_type:complete